MLILACRLQAEFTGMINHNSHSLKNNLFLAWPDSEFACETKGYPCPFVFFALVFGKLVQSVLTVSCQAMLLAHALRTFSGGAFSPSLAFLVLNMTVTTLMLLVNLLEAGLRTGFLGSLQTADEKDREGAAERSDSRRRSSRSHDDHGHHSHVRGRSGSGSGSFSGRASIELTPQSNPMFGQQQQQQEGQQGQQQKQQQGKGGEGINYEAYTGYSAEEVVQWDRRSLSDTHRLSASKRMGGSSSTGKSAIFDAIAPMSQQGVRRDSSPLDPNPHHNPNRKDSSSALALDLRSSTSSRLSGNSEEIGGMGTGALGGQVRVAPPPAASVWIQPSPALIRPHSRLHFAPPAAPHLAPIAGRIDVSKRSSLINACLPPGALAADARPMRGSAPPPPVAATSPTFSRSPMH